MPLNNYAMNWGQQPQQGTFPMQAPNIRPPHEESWLNMQQFTPQIPSQQFGQLGSVGNPITQGNGTFNPDVFGSMAGANGATPAALSGWDRVKGWFGNASQEGGNIFGEMTKDGYAPSGLSTAFDMGGKLFGAWGGMQDRKLAKKQFNFTKDAFNKQYDAQKQLTNTRMEDRQNARNAADSSRYQDTAEYMKKNEVK